MAEKLPYPDSSDTVAPPSAPPPPYAPPPYLAPSQGVPQYPPPGQGYSWQPPPGPQNTEQSHLVGTGDPSSQGQNPVQPKGGYPAPPSYAAPGYPAQHVNQAQPGYPPYPGYQQGRMTTQHQVTVVQGGPNVIVTPTVAPPDYCGLAWFSCLFCFWPVGLCAIIKSSETRNAINRGDIVAAQQFSAETRKYANYAIAIQITIVVVIIVIRLALIAVY